MRKNSPRKKFGLLPRKYNFSLNPYPEMKFSRCPDCQNKTGQRTLPLILHIAPNIFVAINCTNRYCKFCDMLIGHACEIEHHLTEKFLEIDPKIIGNKYIVFGTVEKKNWLESMDPSKPLIEMREHIHDFISIQTIQMTMGGWFAKGVSPPIMIPPPPLEWVKK